MSATHLVVRETTWLFSRHTFAFSPRVPREFYLKRFALRNRGRGECRVPGAPAASCAHGVVSMHTSIHSEVAGSTRHSPRNGFTADLPLKFHPVAIRVSADVTPFGAV